MKNTTKPAKAASLRDAQVWMVAAITGAEADAEPETVERWVTSGPRLDAAGRFDIYRSGYHARLHECLLDDYPVLAAILDSDSHGNSHGQFEALCHAYVGRHPSASPNLNAFGRHMAAFCRDSKLADDSALPSFAQSGFGAFASELATLEWALVEVLHAETAPPLEIAALQALPPEAWARARFITSDALRVYRFEYPVNAVFIANRIEEIIRDVPGLDANAVAVYRKDMTLWRMDLTAPMMNVLGPLLEGKTLGEALATIEAEVTDPEVLAQTGANLMVWFREWVDAGFFTRIELVAETRSSTE